MADVYVNALTTISTEPTTTDSLVAVNRNTNEGKIIDYNLLASAILDKLTSKTFSALNTSSKLVTGAINELDSDISSLNSRIDDTTSRTTLDSTYTSSNRLYWFRYAQNATSNPHAGNSGFCFEMWLSSTTCVQFAVSAEPAYYVRKLVNGAWSDWLDLNGEVSAIEPIIVAVSANSSTTIDEYISSNSDRRLLAMGHSSNTALHGLYLCLSSSLVIPLIEATGLTVTVSNGKVTIANLTSSTASGVLLA